MAIKHVEEIDCAVAWKLGIMECMTLEKTNQTISKAENST
jgi:hypothetical protein